MKSTQKMDKLVKRYPGLAHNTKIHNQFERIRRGKGNTEGSLDSRILAKNGYDRHDNGSPSDDSASSNSDLQVFNDVTEHINMLDNSELGSNFENEQANMDLSADSNQNARTRRQKLLRQKKSREKSLKEKQDSQS